MTPELEIGLYIFVLAGFLGYHVITRIPPLLHTPLMSATNAMSGISLVGSLVVAGANFDSLSNLFGFIAVACSSTNVVGGFLITDRMLAMFKTGKQISERAGQQESRGRKAAIWLLIGVSVAGLIYWFRDLKTYLDAHGFTQIMSFFYIISAVLFIFGLKGLSSPKYARRGMWAAALGMVMALLGTLFHPVIVTYQGILAGLAIGTFVGGSLGLYVPMTAVPQRTALSHSLGALAATLIGVSEYIRHGNEIGRVMMTALGFEVIIGGLTFTGSLMAAGKLQELLPGRPMTYKGQNVSNFALLALVILSFGSLIVAPRPTPLFYLMVGLSLLFGFLLVIPIGAADMPVVIALLNSYAGLADAAMGFVLSNRIQIITGSLDGTSGFLLAILMCRAMNRSATNVLFGAFGQIQVDESTVAADAKGTVRSIAPEELSTLIESFRSVIVVPGYGMAVAQAQHVVGELAELLEKRGLDVKYAIHPVAGRMPGHMNVLLAEADVPYDRLYEMERINPYFAETDLALVVGANDVTNPAARSNKSSPLYGMPILEVDRAKAIVVLKRSMRPGFAGVDNELYFNPKCMMLFGDAKDSLGKLITALRS